MRSKRKSANAVDTNQEASEAGAEHSAPKQQKLDKTESNNIDLNVGADTSDGSTRLENLPEIQDSNDLGVHLDGIQSDLKTLSDILKDDDLSSDDNTIMGLFNADDDLFLSDPHGEQWPAKEKTAQGAEENSTELVQYYSTPCFNLFDMISDVTPDKLLQDPLAEDDLAEDDLAEDDLAEDDLAEDDLAEDDLAEDDLAEDDLAEDDLAEDRDSTMSELSTLLPLELEIDPISPDILSIPEPEQS